MLLRQSRICRTSPPRLDGESKMAMAILTSSDLGDFPMLKLQVFLFQRFEVGKN